MKVSKLKNDYNVLIKRIYRGIEHIKNVDDEDLEKSIKHWNDLVYQSNVVKLRLEELGVEMTSNEILQGF